MEFIWKCDIRLGCKALRLKAKDVDRIHYCQEDGRRIGRSSEMPVLRGGWGRFELSQTVREFCVLGSTEQMHPHNVGAENALYVFPRPDKKKQTVERQAATKTFWPRIAFNLDEPR